MINVLVPIVDNELAYQQMLDELSKQKDVKIYCGVRESLKDKINFPKGVDVKTFNSKSKKEEILNSLSTDSMQEGGVMVLRRPISLEEFESLKASDADIVRLQKHRSKFAEFWTNLWKKIIRAIFAFFYFEDISAIYFKENMFKLVKNLNNLSYITRIDRFIGYKQETIESSVKPPKKDYDVFMNVAQLVISILFVALCVVWSIVFCSSGANIVIMVLLSVFIMLISLIVLLVSVLSFVRSIYVGKLDYGRAEEI